MLTHTIILGFLALALTVKAEQTCNKDPALSDSSVPQLKLPWGTWNASCHEKDDKIYVFRNVRFGKKPERFSRSFRPDPIPLNNSIQTFTENISCVQLNPLQLQDPPGGRLRLGNPEGSNARSNEDCLFLDIYAPVSAFQSKTDLLPVIVWFHGGAYAFGSKNPDDSMGSGQSILKASNYSVIFITGNYRLGAFGWLAGDYMQKEGQPNAGLYDQSLLLSWVQDYVDQVQGDKSQVSAWGQSAGAGSILHHLIREDGEQDPLFSTFAVLSPAFQWSWDNSPDGRLDQIYMDFSDLAGCGRKYNISCLRDASLTALKIANTRLFAQSKTKGFFPVGPSVDGSWIKTIPTVAFSQRKFWKGIKSGLTSHCGNEIGRFNSEIKTPEDFDRFLSDFLPGSNLTPVRDAIKGKYNYTTKCGGDINKCLSTIIRDSSFTCNTRDLFKAYPAASYMMQYSFPFPESAYHTVDLIPLFTNDKQEIIGILKKNMNMTNEQAELYATHLLEDISEIYQSYFASFALSGDPNKCLATSRPLWHPADGSADQLSRVLDVKYSLWPSPSNNFHDIEDDQNMNSACSFWAEMAKSITPAQPNIDIERIPPLDDPEEL
ncbi:carboxylesterase family protein [Biscogniauxia mediterranea]|nr:carboxylesterase family protein [Biscogniauxia mediterranea]